MQAVHPQFDQPYRRCRPISDSRHDGLNATKLTLEKVSCKTTLLNLGSPRATGRCMHYTRNSLGGQCRRIRLSQDQ